MIHHVKRPERGAKCGGDAGKKFDRMEQQILGWAEQIAELHFPSAS